VSHVGKLYNLLAHQLDEAATRRNPMLLRAYKNLQLKSNLIPHTWDF
jgi:S-adenosylmethionine synthetase